MSGLQRFAGWVRADPDRACAAFVLSMLGSIALAGSATHVLHVGEYPSVKVSGWMIWTVAGSLEVLCAYAAWEVRRRSGWDRVVPALVFAASFAFIVLANLAAADPHSWAARLPWAQAFAVTPPVGFISVTAIAETRGWERPKRRGQKKPKGQGHGAGSGQGHEPPNPQASGGSGAGSGHPGLHPVPPIVEPGPPTLDPGETREQTATRWVQEGHRHGVMVDACMTLFDVSESTAKRVIRDAREGLEATA